MEGKYKKIEFGHDVTCDRHFITFLVIATLPHPNNKLRWIFKEITLIVVKKGKLYKSWKKIISVTISTNFCLAMKGIQQFKILKFPIMIFKFHKGNKQMFYFNLIGSSNSISYYVLIDFLLTILTFLYISETIKRIHSIINIE